MKLVKPLTGLAAIAILAGCAAAPPDKYPTAYAKLDLDKVQRVEQQARSTGTQVIWVNIPKKGRQQ